MNISQWHANRLLKGEPQVSAQLFRLVQKGVFAPREAWRIYGGKFAELFDSLGKNYSKAAQMLFAKRLMEFVDPVALQYMLEGPNGPGRTPKSDVDRIKAITGYVTDVDSQKSLNKSVGSDFIGRIADRKIKTSFLRMAMELEHIALADLTKAVDQKAWGRISKSHSPDYSETVDHSYHTDNSTVPDKYVKMLGEEKVHKHLKNINNGIAAKMIHNIPDKSGDDFGETFMAKPYHKKLESATRSWVKHPITGWSTMANKALYDAGGISHLTEDVSAHQHDGTPLTVHQFDMSKKSLMDAAPGGPPSIPKEYNFNPLHINQIGIMDYLSNNLDRHAGNILLPNDKSQVDEQGYSPIRGIDHERSFQYHKHIIDLSYDTPQRYITHSVLDNLKRNYSQSDYGQVADWWKEKGSHIKDALHKQLIGIKDEKLRDHIRSNFDSRVGVMDKWAKDMAKGDPYDQESLENGVEPTSVQKYKTEPLRIKSLLSKLPQDDPKAALGILADAVNSKDRLNYNQLSGIHQAVHSLLENRSPDETVDIYNHVMHNPKFNSAKMLRSSFNPMDVIINQMYDKAHDNAPGQDAAPNAEHLHKFISFIDSLPREKKANLHVWRNRFLMALDRKNRE